MALYFAIFLTTVLATFIPWKAIGSLSRIQWILSGVVLIIIIGLRHNVGGDWGNYIFNYAYLEGMKWSEAKLIILMKDPGYVFIYWFSLKYLNGNGIYATNLICATIFVIGLIKLCRSLSPMPWLALVIAMPFVILIVSMGYTRQSAALGFLMYGIVGLVNGKYLQYYMLLVIGSLFHSTLIVMVFVGILYNYKFTIRKNIGVIIFALLIVQLIIFKKDQLDFLIYHYITNTELKSEGAMLRVLINAIPALIMIMYRDKFRERFDDTRLWLILSLMAILLIPASYYISTVADRIAIYSTPLQLIVLSRFPVLIQSINLRTLFVIVVITMYLLSMVVWLNYGIHASGWMPYENFILQ